MWCVVGLSVGQRVLVLRCLVAGVSTKQIAAGLGVDRGRVKRFVLSHGLRSAYGPAGGLTPESLRTAQVVLGTLVDMSDEGYTDEAGRLTLVGRCMIYAMLQDGRSKARIARAVGVDRSSIGREIRRNSDASGHYCPARAQRLTDERRKRPKVRKLDQCPKLRRAVVQGLNNKWSPLQISMCLDLLCEGDPTMTISHEAIYQSLYIQGKGALRHELTCEKATRSGRTTRKPRSKLPARSKRSWIGEGNIIANRPVEVEDRRVPGHWEGDLIIGKGGKNAVITLVERTTRYVILKALRLTHDSPTVTQAVTEMIKTLPASLRKTLTWDQGAEMADHATITLATNMDIYFCDPHSPWQRGTNENTNGLLRDYWPKGTDFSKLTDEEATRVQDQLNGRPRKTLGYTPPHEKMKELLDVATTT